MLFFTSLAFYEVCVEHNVRTGTEFQAKATELNEKGERAMLVYFLDNDGDGQLAKVLRAIAAKGRARRQSPSLGEFLEEHVSERFASAARKDTAYQQ